MPRLERLERLERIPTPAYRKLTVRELTHESESADCSGSTPPPCEIQKLRRAYHLELGFVERS